MSKHRREERTRKKKQLHVAVKARSRHSYCGNNVTGGGWEKRVHGRPTVAVNLTWWQQLLARKQQHKDEDAEAA